jgi:DNA sulfur modification protein DndD
VILQRLHIENFRQFHGTQDIEFAASENRNVTLVHGFNGAGKTALLNAFVWCLYGQTTPDFESPDRLASEAAVMAVPDGGAIIVRVRLTFKNRDGVYVVDRSQTVTRRGNDQVSGQPQLDLSVQKAGESELISIGSAMQSRINTLLSETLYPFFFFNGERVEWLASADAYEEVEEGLKSLLDIKIYERSLGHLRTVIRELAAELKNHGTEELQTAISELQQLEEKGEELNAAQKGASQQIAALEAEKEAFEREQHELEALADLVTQRDSFRRQREIYKTQLDQRTAELASSLSRDGYLALAAPELGAARQEVAAARQRGELPAKIKPQFVEDLLQQKVCICGRPLDEAHEHEVAALKTWQQNVGLAEYEELVSQTHAAVERLEERRLSFFRTVDEVQGIRSNLKAQIRDIDDHLGEIEGKLGDPTAGDRAVSLAEQISRVTSDLIDRKADLKSYGKDIKENADARAEANRRIERLQTRDKQGDLIKRQRTAVEHVLSALEQIYALRKDDVRRDLSARIERLWQDAAIKDYKASVNEEFQLRLTKKVAGIEQPVHGASTGEKQVLALSFVGSLVEKARHNLEESGESEMDVEQGGQYPLVMDSPFGSLEDDYRAKVAHWIPKLANQVVILVSKTQWRVEVEREIRPRIGKEYILELHSTKPDCGRSIDISGDTFPYVVETTDPYERTQIKLVGK